MPTLRTVWPARPWHGTCMRHNAPCRNHARPMAQCVTARYVPVANRRLPGDRQEPCQAAKVLKRKGFPSITECPFFFLIIIIIPLSRCRKARPSAGLRGSPDQMRMIMRMELWTPTDFIPTIFWVYYISLHQREVATFS